MRIMDENFMDALSEEQNRVLRDISSKLDEVLYYAKKGGGNNEEKDTN